MAAPKQRYSLPPRSNSSPLAGQPPERAGCPSFTLDVKARYDFYGCVKRRVIAKRFEDPVEVPSVVLEGSGAAQESWQTNMVNHQAVRSIATRMAYSEAALAVDGCRHEYSEGAFFGFMAVE